MSGAHQYRTVTDDPTASATARARSAGEPSGRARHVPAGRNSRAATALVRDRAGSTAPGKKTLSTTTGMSGSVTGGRATAWNRSHSPRHRALQRDVRAHPWKYSGGFGTMTTTCGSLSKSMHRPASDSKAKSA